MLSSTISTDHSATHSSFPSCYIIKDDDWKITKTMKIIFQYFTTYSSLNRNILNLHTLNIKWLRSDQIRSLNLEVLSSNQAISQLNNLMKYREATLTRSQKRIIQEKLYPPPPSIPDETPALTINDSNETPSSSKQLTYYGEISCFSDKSDPQISAEDLAAINAILIEDHNARRNISNVLASDPLEKKSELISHNIFALAKNNASILRDKIEDPSINILEMYQNVNIPSIQASYREMLQFSYENRSILGHNQHTSNTLHTQPFGNVLETYYANVFSAHSTFSNFQKSLYGMANLLQYGPQILNDMRNKLFVGNPRSYKEREGINLMRAVTGQVVDLDTKLLPSLPNKQQVARTLIDGFKTQFSKFDFSVNSRDKTLEIPNSSNPRGFTTFGADQIPISYNNEDRGEIGLWKYKRDGNYYVNVPDLHAVIDALLLSPFLLAEVWEHLKICYSYDPQELSEERIKLISYLMNGGDYIPNAHKSDSSGFLKCFNEKLETIKKVHAKHFFPTLNPKDTAIAKYGKKKVENAISFNSLYGDGVSITHFFPLLKKHLKDSHSIDLDEELTRIKTYDGIDLELDSILNTISSKGWNFAVLSDLNTHLYQQDLENEFKILNADLFRGLLKKYLQYEVHS
jgi:hypothetical protein